jgi:asparagine synthase (glutamine-hydrolysing)
MVVAIMSQDLKADFKTFSIGVGETSLNELPFARTVAEHHNTDHIEALAEPDLIGSLPDMIWHLDEPSDPIAACQYQAAALASDHVKVVLGGDGGDELFAGFDRYFGMGYVGYYALLPSVIRNHLIGGILRLLPEGFGYKSVSQKLRWLQRLSVAASPGERYAEATCFFRFNHQQKKELFSSELWQSVSHLNSAGVIAKEFDRAPSTDSLDRMLYADYKTRLPEHSLMLTDRMSMAHGLELRSPFLDHELVSLMASFPSRLKINGSELKYVLRRLGRDYLPKEILKRNKQGFMFPIAKWLREELHPLVSEYLPRTYFVKEGLIRTDVVAQMAEEHRRKRIDHHVRLWMLLNLAVWHKICVLGMDCSAVREEVMQYRQPS